MGGGWKEGSPALQERPPRMRTEKQLLSPELCRLCPVCAFETGICSWSPRFREKMAQLLLAPTPLSWEGDSRHVCMRPPASFPLAFLS